MKKNIALFLYSILLTTATMDLNGQKLTNGNSVLIIDQDISNLKMILKSLKSGTRLVYLDKVVAPLSAIDKIIKENAPLKSLHIMTNGKPGVLVFSNHEINKNIIEQSEKILARWKQYFPDGGDILLYGCEVGKGLEGADFIHTLSSITGIDIAASNNMTGSTLKGADWDLELTIGEIEASAVLSDVVLRSYASVLGK